MTPIVQFLKVFASMLKSGKMSYSDALTRFRAQYARPAEGMEKAAILKEVEKAPSNIVQFPKERITPFHKPRPGDPNYADSVIKDLKSRDPIDAMKEANSIIGRKNPSYKGPYKNLSDDEAQRILKETDDHIFQRDVQYDEFGDPIKPDPEDFASGGVAGQLHLHRQGFPFGGRALKAIMDAWRANKTWGVGGPPYKPEKTSFNIKEMTKRNLGQEFSLKELKEISESPFGEFASRGTARGTGRAPPTFKEFNTEFKNIKARILKEKMMERKLEAKAMINAAEKTMKDAIEEGGNVAMAKRITDQMKRESKNALEEVREGLKAIDIYMGMTQKKGRTLQAEGGLAHVLGV